MGGRAKVRGARHTEQALSAALGEGTSRKQRLEGIRFPST